MLHLNEYQLTQLNQARHEDLLRQVEHERLVQVAQSAAQPAHAAALATLGSALINLGTRLQGADERQPVQQKTYR